MTCELEFEKSVLKEWNKIGATVRAQFKKKLLQILVEPHTPSAELSGVNDLYKIKLRQSGHRLVYQVIDQVMTVSVIAIGKRAGSNVYKTT